ncbi:MAG: hypothetical protein IJN90_04360 [Bacilli bacterium]|nr:hypothetical protein [Bacilli bacterium]
MNFLWIDLECCTMTNYIIATIVKTLLIMMKYIVPLVLIILAILKFTSKKKEIRKKRVKKITIYIVIAIISFILALFIDLVLGIKPSVSETDNQTWHDCYIGICQIK